MYAANGSIPLIREKELPAAKPPLVSLLRSLKPTVLVRQGGREGGRGMKQPYSAPTLTEQMTRLNGRESGIMWSKKGMVETQ